MLGDESMAKTRKRLEIKISKTKSEWVWDIIGLMVYVASIFFLIFVWNKLPDQVPGHYNAQGEIDRMGSKFELLLFPGIGLFMILFIRFFERHPELHNYPQRFNESNAKQFYLQSRKLANQLKNICLIIFTLLLFESVSIALGWWSGFGIWLLPLILVGTFTPIIMGLIQQSRIK
jgi:uncharacterized membrane protein